MVQRKASSNKLGIQADSKTSVKSEKRSSGLKPSSSQHHDNRNKGGTELKRKKSRSIKLSDLESLGSSSSVKRVAPCPDISSTAATTPQKLSPIRTSDSSPNYMKSTSSFDARKERSSVSSRSSQTRQRNLNCSKFTSAASVHKLARTLTKTSSLKPVRTLTKVASVKHVRPSMKKCSGVVDLCPDLNVGRATCSSTLKDSKFPDYVMLHPEGAETEGTSVMKVCPYTYCSLNGHRHAQLPPLKQFLSARRRSWRTQKSIKLKVLSPVRSRSKPADERKISIDTGQIVFSEEPSIHEAVSDGAASSPPTEAGTDFFIEIYAKSREDAGEPVGGSIVDRGIEETSIGSAVNPEREGDNENVIEMLQDESSYSEISFEYHFDQNSDFLATEVNIPMMIHDRGMQVEVEEADNEDSCSIQEETTMECCCIGSGSKDEIPAEIELDESTFEATDMDWEEEQAVIPNGVNDPILTDDQSDSIVAFLPEFENPAMHCKIFFRPDDVFSQCSEEVVMDGEAPEDICEEITASESTFTEFSDGASESNNEDGNSEVDVLTDVSDELSVTSNSLSTEDAYEKSTAAVEGPNGDEKPSDDFMNSMVSSSSSAEDQALELTADSEDKNILVESDDQFHQEYYTLLGNDEPNSSADEELEIHACIEKTKSLQDDPEFDHNVTAEDPIINTEDVAPLPEPEDEICIDDHSQEQAYHSVDVSDEVDKEDKVDDVNALLEIEISDSGQGFSEADQAVGKENHNTGHDTVEHCLIDSIGEEKKLEQEVSSEILLPQTLNHSTETDSSIMVDNQELSEKDQGNDGSGGNRSSSADTIINEDEEIQEKDNSKQDAAETPVAAIKSTCSEEGNAVNNAGNSSTQQLFKTCSNLKGRTRCKRPIKDMEEVREFNPREPRYLPLQPDPEAEKVDLRHQMTDERKNAEEWMLDYALRQAVNKLAPARKRKVALLVEAFETVIPLPKYEPHLTHANADFAHPRPIQACS